jgi:hypothetical protein
MSNESACTWVCCSTMSSIHTIHVPTGICFACFFVHYASYSHCRVLFLPVICDVHGKFLDVSFVFPGSTSYLLVLDGSSLMKKNLGGLLHAEFCLFGDNAYVNADFMANPCIDVYGGSKDANASYQSQARIRIERAFGILTHRWEILRKAMPMNITIFKTIEMVLTLCKLHNFRINERDTIIDQAILS